jgi:succinoglycan biosynthesis transport protein ExoP
VFVIEAGVSKSSQAKAAIARLTGAGGRLLGAVLTKFDARKSGYGDDYAYLYTYGNENEPKRG